MSQSVLLSLIGALLALIASGIGWLLLQLVAGQKETNHTLSEFVEESRHGQKVVEVRLARIEDRQEFFEKQCEWKHQNGRRRADAA